jgi:hypothetical protein
MKTAIVATLLAAAGLLVANMLGVASAEAPTTTTASPRTVSVEGVGKAPVPQGASATVATESYRQAMASAVTDGLGKAEFLASKTGVTLGAPQSVVEDGGSISCAASPEAEYVGYEGEQPDFPSTDGPVVAPAELAGAAKPGVSVKAKVKHRAKRRAKKATAATCGLSAQVSIVYAIS